MNVDKCENNNTLNINFISFLIKCTVSMHTYLHNIQQYLNYCLCSKNMKSWKRTYRCLLRWYELVQPEIWWHLRAMAHFCLLWESMLQKEQLWSSRPDPKESRCRNYLHRWKLLSPDQSTVWRFFPPWLTHPWRAPVL